MGSPPTGRPPTNGNDGPRYRAARRRPLLIALASGAAAVTGPGAAAHSEAVANRERDSGRRRLRLSAGGMGVEWLELPLAGRLSEAGPDEWRSARFVTSTHSMVGFTWRRGQREPHLHVSSRIGGVWKPWQRMPHPHEAPDAAAGDVTDRVGTELAWVGHADGIRIRGTGSRPAGLALVLLYPTPLPTDRDRAGARKSRLDDPLAGRSRSAAAHGGVPRPRIRTRKRWGANERWRNGRPEYVETIKQVHVHHTVNSNDYRRRDVPALIRGMYAYHTQILGWSDIGYNFLVDRFGRIWVGRAGGPGRPVRGAHTLGFNATSTGVAAIGNFDIAEPRRVVIRAVARLAAWKLERYHRDPAGRIRVLSEGSGKYRAGRRVLLPVIDGHRDTNHTACPGQHLYDALPRIRRRARRRIERFAA